jgi:uncharacterized protein (DUF2141 family)
MMILAFLMLTWISGSTAEDKGELILEINQVASASGVIWVGIYDSEANYLVKEKAIIREIRVHQKGKAQIHVRNLPYGTYAIALFHDVNGNGELDQNFFGIPTEPYAFSKTPATKWRLPYFREVAFPFRSKLHLIKTTLRRWDQ